MAGFLAERADYEVITWRWVRRRGRRSGATIPSLVEMVTGFDRESRLDDEAIAFVDRYFDSPFGDFQAKYTGRFEALLRFRDANSEGMGRHVGFSRSDDFLPATGHSPPDRFYRIRCCIVHGSDIKLTLTPFAANLEYYLKQKIVFLLK